MKDQTIEQTVFKYLTSTDNTILDKTNMIWLLNHFNEKMTTKQFNELTVRTEQNNFVNENHESVLVGHLGDVFVWGKKYGKAGIAVEGHQHNQDHIHLLTTGSVRFISDDTETYKDYVAPCAIEIPKHINHKMIALEDDTSGFCVFAIRNEDGELTTIENSDMNQYNSFMDEKDKTIRNNKSSREQFNDDFKELNFIIKNNP